MGAPGLLPPPPWLRYAPSEENKKSLCKFYARFLAFSNEISAVQKIVLSSSRGQGNFRGLEASRPRPRTWPSRPRPRTSKCVLEDVLEAKDVLEDSTSGQQAAISDLPSYDIFVSQKLPLWKNFDDVISCDLWFRPLPIKNSGYAYELEIAWKKFFKTFIFWEHLRLCPLSLVLGLGLEHSCSWPREVLSSERLSLASNFFGVLGLGLEPCVLDSTSVIACDQ